MWWHKVCGDVGHKGKSTDTGNTNAGTGNTRTEGTSTGTEKTSISTKTKTKTKTKTNIKKPLWDAPFLTPLFFVLFLLGGCGFQPLLSETGDTPQSLETIKIDLIKDRLGQQLRNRLLELLTPSGVAVSPRYVLKVQLSESEQEISFQKSLVARRKTMDIQGSLVLMSMETGKTLWTGTCKASTSFSLGATSDFSALSAYASEEDARKQMVEILAQDIRLQMALALKEVGADSCVHGSQKTGLSAQP